MRRCPWLRRAAGVMAVGLAIAFWGFHGAPSGWAGVRNPKGVAEIIGNRDYEHRDVPDVAYAHRDAEAFKRYALAVLGFDPNNVIDLRDASRRELFDALGTRGDPSGSLLWSYLDPDGGSEVVVFYSGHGVPGQTDGRGYLLPVDADPKAAEDDGYPIDLLYKNLGGLQEADSVRVFLDACFSGGSHEGGLVGSASPVFVEAALPEGAGEKVTALTAASGTQIASWDEKAKHGLFTHHLMDALHGKGDADKDGKVTAKEARTYLDRHMTRAARRMHRRVQRASLMGSGDVVLALAVGGQGFPGRSGRAAEGRTEAGETPEEAAGAPPPPAPEGLDHLDHVAAEKALGLKREAKVLVQLGLAAMKYEVGYADGLFGKRTRGAIKVWQKGKGLPETGYLTREQAEALKAVGEEAGRQLEERKRKARELAERKAKEERERKTKEAAERKARELAELKRPGRVFRDCPECPEMVVVGAGEFMMGSRSGDGHDDERPRHRVRIPAAFAVGKYEVTFDEWDACVAGGGCQGYRPVDKGWGRGGRPVVSVSWRDAKAYVEWLRRRTGKGYRLLSEAEWEYAARAGTETAYWWGDGAGRNRANCDGCGSRWDHRGTAPAGSFEANGYGLHDVHGNIREWVEDCWHGNYRGAPGDGEAWVSGGNCSKHVLRGGSWDLAPGYLRSAFRSGYSTGTRIDDVGFRIARTLTP